MYDDALINVADGRITSLITDTVQIESFLASYPGELINLKPQEFLMPGMIDTHVHAPQYQFTGTATDLPLMEWLDQYTFPAERRCADTDFAAALYARLVCKLLSHGTTTAVYFASIHLEATKRLVDACRAAGQRAFVGKVSMDRHGSEEYEERTADALQDAEAMVDYCHAYEPDVSHPIDRLVNPVLTPRFIPTCSAALLSGLGALYRKHCERGCWVQSHIAESHDEMAFVEALHPARRDADIFDEAGLLTAHCVMAHGVHLNEAELKLFAQRGAAIACCPLSNVYFAGADLPLVKVQSAGVRVGLGTDVAGGYSPSLLSAIRTAVIVSKVHARTAGDEAQVTYSRALWTATMGGALALGLEDHLGSFAVGKQFDAVLVRCDAPSYDSVAEANTGRSALASDLERYIHLGDDRNVERVWVRGEVVATQATAGAS